MVLNLKVKVKSLSHVQLFATPWTVAYQAPPSMEFPRQEYWSGCHYLLQGIFLTQGWNLGLSHCMQTLYCFEPPRTEKYDQAAAENGCDEGDFRGEWTTPALG